jgi:hypothetical protein
VEADDAHLLTVRSELDAFGDLECRACGNDRLHELDHIARAASEQGHALITEDLPLAGTFQGERHERAYRAWCADRGLDPLPPRPPGGRSGA